MKEFEKSFVDLFLTDDYSKILSSDPTVKTRKVECYTNDLYHVIKRDCLEEGIQSDKFPALWWLSIKRLDREPIHDWRHLQLIKDMIIGPNHEAVELYPHDKRLVDMANQYHLFVIKEPDMVFPFGFTERSTATPEEAASVGAKQRPC